MNAVARRGDPDTSWAAARSIDAATLRASQLTVLRIIAEQGPMTDETLVDILYGSMSPSGARTRRSELVAAGLVYDTGDRETLESGRHAIRWAFGRRAAPAAESETVPIWDDLR